MGFAKGFSTIGQSDVLGMTQSHGVCLAANFGDSAFSGLSRLTMFHPG